MEINVKQLIEEMDALIEDEMVDEFEVSNEPQEAELEAPTEEPISRTEQLDAKTKISRALDTLITAVDDFKNATVIELDTLDQMDLVNAVDKFDEVIKEIENILDGENNNSQLVEEPAEEELEEPQEELDQEPMEDDQEQEVDFDSEASLDLFSDEE